MKPKNNSLCPICKVDKKSPNDKYCKNHLQAKAGLQKGYESWLKAYSILSWEDYLKQLLDLGDQVGNLIRDVVEYEFYFKEN
ncbi:MAG: hypothetical protein H7641_03195 [Candidatus Heimdallarchaeota archaeon]|nr:hypothetical protein [Candidatus Heimdallarchaeota archaeon]MCK4876570.1 hypothetical protein [Candidatus Heimdallarchaeota archaeon]